MYSFCLFIVVVFCILNYLKGGERDYCSRKKNRANELNWEAQNNVFMLINLELFAVEIPFVIYALSLLTFCQGACSSL